MNNIDTPRTSVLFRELLVEQSLVISYPSHLYNTYEPGPEYIIQPVLRIPESTITITVRSETAHCRISQSKSPTRDKLRALIFSPRQISPYSLGSSFFYDARNIYNNNIAHLIQHHAAVLGFIREQLGLGSNAVTIILEKDPPALACHVFKLLGYDIISTNASVTGTRISVDADDSNFFHLLPSCGSLELNTWVVDTPKSIFISRRKTRRLKNEDELIEQLASFGFKTLYFEDLSIIEQWSAVRSADEIVAIHGAALGSLAFKACGGQLDFHLVELFGSGFIVNPFRKYCAVLSPDSTWIGCRGRLEPSIIRDIDIPGREKSHAFDSFEVTPEVVKSAIKYRMSKTASFTIPSL